MVTKIIIVSILLLTCFFVLSQRVYKTRHFKIHYTSFDDQNINKIADSLETNYSRIIDNLKSNELGRISVYFYTDTSDLRKNFPDLPAWATGLSVGVSAIHILSPNYANQDYRSTINHTIHELVHCITKKINNKIDNNSRWLWESVAIYESNQNSNPQLVPCLIYQYPPTIPDLNKLSNTDIYDVGYFIVDYLVSTNGNKILNSLIKNNGNLKLVLNMDNNEFTKQWFDFVKIKYRL